MARPSLDTLREKVRGHIITADDPGYDEARAVHNGMHDKRPAAVVRAEQVADVMAAVDYAREAGLDLAIRGGGHSVPGFGTLDGGIVIDLAPMKQVHVDPASRTARAGGGATWGDFNHATHAFGLATTGGFISTTGVGGLTLGGGIGYLSRLYGLSIDNLLSAGVVTADGRYVTASREENPDLFWALRGGGGNFGVVTSFDFQLHDLEAVYFGPIFYDLEHAGDMLRLYREVMSEAPRELGGFPAIMLAPPLPFVPAARHGKPVCGIVVCWAGAHEQAERQVAPFREVAPVLAEHVEWLPYPAINQVFDDLYPKGIRQYWKSNFVKRLGDEAIAAHLEHGPRVADPSSSMHLFPINGAVHDVGVEETAFPARDATFSALLLAAWHEPSLDASRIQWVRDYYAALEPLSEPGGYINFMDRDDTGRVRSSYAQNHARLVELKRKWDPDNLFHVNQNISPSG